MPALLVGTRMQVFLVILIQPDDVRGSKVIALCVLKLSTRWK